MCKKVSKRKKKKLSQKQYANLQKRYRNIITCGESELPAIPEKPNGKRGKMAKVKQKVSGCFRAKNYAIAYCRISSYLQTMASKGYNPLIAIQMALAGKFV